MCPLIRLANPNITLCFVGETQKLQPPAVSIDTWSQDVAEPNIQIKLDRNQVKLITK